MPKPTFGYVCTERAWYTDEAAHIPMATRGFVGNRKGVYILHQMCSAQQVGTKGRVLPEVYGLRIHSP